MTVLARPKQAKASLRRRQSAAGHHPGRSVAAEQRQGQEPTGSGHRHPGTGRLANDRAVYKCQCGYVFEAPVCTSVGCPHCGGTQAW